MPGMISSIKVDNLCKPMECPIGLNAEPLLPCGCREDLAFFEMWAVARGVWTETRLVNSKTVPQVSLMLRITRHITNNKKNKRLCRYLYGTICIACSMLR